jgi:hypothetical protein
MGALSDGVSTGQRCVSQGVSFSQDCIEVVVSAKSCLEIALRKYFVSLSYALCILMRMFAGETRTAVASAG